MREPRKVIVRGTQRRSIDPEQLVQVLLLIAEEWDKPERAHESPDMFDAAIEDKGIAS